MKSLNRNRIGHSIWILASLMLSGFLGRAGIGLAAEDTWTQKADMPTARWLHSASVVDGKVYAIGGAGSEPATEAVWPVEVYDPITDTWTQKADIPTGRALLSTSVVDGKIYTIGGIGGTSTVEVYDPATDTWTRKADLPTPRGALSTSVVDGKIYAIGGMTSIDNQVGLSTVEMYDPATDTWTRKANLPTPRYALSTSVVDGQIYAIGGASQEPGVRTLEAYDPATDTWTIKADMHTARRNFSTCVVAGRIYAIGGWDRSFHYPYAIVEQYDPVTDTWTMKADLPEPRACFSTSVVNGRIYLIGGTFRPHPCTALSTVYELTISTLPVVDFNGDGIVDSIDMCMMIDYWGTDEPLYDIAPPPFGDGIVDVQDLIVVAEHLFEEVLPVGLISYWKLDETEGGIAEDTAGDNDGIVYGEAFWQTEGGVKGGALQLDGIEDYISTDFVLNPADGPFSVFAWVNSSVPGGVVISQLDGIGGSGETWLGTEAVSGKLMTGLVPPPVGRFIPQSLVSQSVITDGQWHNVGFVWDGAYRSLYVDGIEVAKDTAAQNPLKSATGGLYIGASKTLEAGTFFSGLIDDVRIYSVALSAEEVAALAQ